MKQKIKPYIYILILIVFSSGFFAQELTLKISSKEINGVSILKEVKFQKNHIDSLSIKIEVNKISNYLKSIGYFTNTIDNISKINKTYTAQFTLGKKIDKIIIRNNTKDILKLIDFIKNNDTIIIPIKKLQFVLNSISKKSEKQGGSFSRVQLLNIEIKGKVIFADLKIHQSKKRKIDKVIIKGYKLFSKSHIKYHLNIKEKTIFNKEKIKEISSLTKSLQFVKETKKPEVLFTKDSTILYIYVKKQQNNSFDGLVNFTSKEKGGLLFNGHVDLKLNNILNVGEKFELFWNSIGEEKQELKISTEIPYLFNSPISPLISFNLFKQDSTFLNTEFKTNISYNINSKTKIAVTYSNVDSKKIQENPTNNNIEEFKNSFFGIIFSYSIPKNDVFFNNKFYLKISPTMGNRNSKNNTTKQIKLELTSSYIWDINQRNSLLIKNKTGYLKSDNYLENELFRIGGANSIRGFNEQSVYTNSFIGFNIEYRFLTSQASYLYTITDMANINTVSSNINILGIGIGYLFKTNNSQINLSTAIGKSTSNSFDFSKSKIIINWKTFF